MPNGPVLFHVSTRDRAMFGSPSEILGRLCGGESPGWNSEPNHNQHVLIFVKSVWLCQVNMKIACCHTP